MNLQKACRISPPHRSAVANQHRRNRPPLFRGGIAFGRLALFPFGGDCTSAASKCARSVAITFSRFQESPPASPASFPDGNPLRGWRGRRALRAAVFRPAILVVPTKQRARPNSYDAVAAAIASFAACALARLVAAAAFLLPERV